MIFHRPRSFRVHTWTDDHVIITGAYWGWSGLLFPVAAIAMLPSLLVFLFSKWALIGLPILLIAAFGARFRLVIHRTSMAITGSFLGYHFVHDQVPTDAANVQLGFDWDRIAPPDIEIGNVAIGDETNAMALFHTIQAAIAHVGDHMETKKAHLGLANPITAAPTRDPVDVTTAVEVIQRYQHLNYEVLMAKGCVLYDDTRITLYVAHEQCTLVFDAYILTTEIPELEALGPTPAQDDEMALTDNRRFVWTGSPFRLWQHGTPIARLYPDVFWIAKHGEIPRKDIASVRGWLTKNWGKMGVELNLHNALPVPIASSINTDIHLFYDGIDLMFDVEWVEYVTRMLADELNVPGIEDNLNGAQ